MTQVEREDLVERYLAGDMNPAQEADFFLHVAVDDELQRTLKAFRIMDQAIVSDREVAVPERAHYRDHVMALLAATEPIASPLPNAASGAGTAAGGGLGMMKTILATVVAGSLTVGTALFVAPMFSEKAPPATSAPKVSSPQLQVTPIAPIDVQQVDTTKPAATADKGLENREDKPAPVEGTGTGKAGRKSSAAKATTAPRQTTAAARETEPSPKRNREVVKLPTQNNGKNMDVKIQKPEGEK